MPTVVPSSGFCFGIWRTQPPNSHMEAAGLPLHRLHVPPDQAAHSSCGSSSTFGAAATPTTSPKSWNVAAYRSPPMVSHCKFLMAIASQTVGKETNTYPWCRFRTRDTVT